MKKKEVFKKAWKNKCKEWLMNRVESLKICNKNSKMLPI